MKTLYQSMKDNRLEKPLEVYEWKPPLTPGRLYRMQSSLIVMLETGVALVLPDDGIKQMINTGMIKPNALSPDRVN